MSFDDWLSENNGEIEQAMAFSVEPLADLPGELSQQLSRAQSEYGRMGFLLAAAESYLTQARAQALLAVINDCPDMTGAERKTIVDDRVKDIKKIRDGLQVTVDTIKTKCFCIMNGRKVHIAEPVE